MRLSVPCEFAAGPGAMRQKARNAQTDCNEKGLRCPQAHAQLAHQLLGRHGESAHRTVCFALPRVAPRSHVIKVRHGLALALLIESSTTRARTASPVTRFRIRLVAFHNP